MRLLSLFFFLFLVNGLNRINGQSVDFVFNSLTLEQKVAKLFITTDSNALNKKNNKPLFYVCSDIKGGGAIINAPLAFDCTNGFVDGYDPAFPSNSVIKSCNKTSLIQNLYNSFFNINPHFNGVLGPYFDGASEYFKLDQSDLEPQYVFYFKKSTDNTNMAAIIEFPDNLLTTKQRQNSEPIKSNVQELSSNQSFNKPLFKKTQGYSINDLLQRNYLFLTSNFNNDVMKLVRAYESNTLNKQLFEERVKWVIANFDKLDITKKALTVKSNALDMQIVARRAVFQSSVVLTRNKNDLLPLRNLRTQPLLFCDFRQTKSVDFLKQVNFHAAATGYCKSVTELDLLITDKTKPVTIVVMCDSIAIMPKVLIQLYREKISCKMANWVLLLGGNVEMQKYVSNDYSFFDATAMLYDDNAFAWECLSEALFGGIAFSGKALYNFPNLSTIGKQIITEPSNMRVGIAAEVGMNAQQLKNIDLVINDAIVANATPGAQILVARNGVVVYNKAFGTTSYDSNKAVELCQLYDIASVTKILATAPIVMHLFDKGKLEINAPINTYLPETFFTNKANITISELLLHKSGLPASMPTFYNLIDRSKLSGNLFSNRKSEDYPYRVDERLYANKSITLRTDLFSNVPSDLFSVRVANNLFLSRKYNDSLYQIMLDAPLDKHKGYKYSDLGIGFLQKIAERITHKTLDQLVDSLFFEPMGLDNICYNPTKKYSVDQIIPTENDELFRHQVLQGYVHDPAAALLGGVAGHAGLFSNSANVAKMMQLYLNKGRWAGNSLIDSNTLNEFTSRQIPTLRRGLGFDKPDSAKVSISPVCAEASTTSFGHLGFTGTIAWADPSNGLVFVFLSNRVNPNAWDKRLIHLDVRSKCMSVAYGAINDN